jgi:hypothetical protein
MVSSHSPKLLSTRFASIAFATENGIMPDVLRFCAWKCRHFVNNRSVSKSGYELAARARKLDLNLSKSMEAMIPFRRVAAELQQAVASSPGFYLGLQML